MSKITELTINGGRLGVFKPEHVFVETLNDHLEKGDESLHVDVKANVGWINRGTWEVSYEVTLDHEESIFVGHRDVHNEELCDALRADWEAIESHLRNLEEFEEASIDTISEEIDRRVDDAVEGYDWEAIADGIDQIIASRQ